MDGRPYGKLLPRYAGPIAGFLCTHPDATRADLIDFVSDAFGVRVSRIALYKFLKKYGPGLDQARPPARRDPVPAGRPPHPGPPTSPRGRAPLAPPLLLGRTAVRGDPFLMLGHARDRLGVARDCFRDPLCGFKTFDLRARRGVGGEPIGVAFLSGSERFRVAVSIAPAVGRFASGRARPLEAVTIDEGFGSPDPQGLQGDGRGAEMRPVSEFPAARHHWCRTSPISRTSFRSATSLAVGDNGTTATPFRR